MKVGLVLYTLYTLYSMALTRPISRLGQTHNRQLYLLKESYHSFLQLQLQIATHSLLSQGDKAVLRAGKRRITQDGRKCASKFQQEGKVYTDCITLKAPDGKNSRAEWCYTDPGEGGATNWDYCAPSLDYDTVREKVNQLAAEFTPQLRKAIELVDHQIEPTAKCAQVYTEIQQQQSVLDQETTLLEKQIKQIAGIQDQLKKMKTKWEGWEKDIQDVIAEIKVLANESPGDPDEDCMGVLGYEKDQPGDGLRGEYYNNEDFLGNPLIKEDIGVDFDWNGQAPMEKIQPDNYSIRWTTFLKVPVSGKYSFKAMSDDGCSVYLNDQLILSHFMGVTDGPKEEGDTPQDNHPVKSHLESNVNNYEEGNMVTPPRKSFTWSKDVALTSDTMYKVQILYYHSIHSKFAEDARNYFKLFWRSDKFTEVEIHADYVYQSNKQSPLKTMGYTSDDMMMFTLANNEPAFLDSTTHFIHDIPSQYLGLVQLKLPQFFMKPEVHLKATAPLILYIAVNMHMANPLPSSFKTTHEVMSLLKTSRFAENVKGKVRASNSYPMKIYKKHFVNGEIDIEFPVEEEEEGEEDEDKKEGSKGGLSMIMWYSLDPTAARALSCGGLETDISRNDGLVYKGCKASSELNEQYKCTFAFTGGLLDQPFKMWSSDGEASGAWIEVEFKEEYKVTKIVYKNRDNMGERSRELEILFSSGVIHEAEVKNTDLPQTITFPPVVCRSIKITFMTVYTSNNNGGAFQVYGMPCKNNDEKPKKKKKKEEEKDETVVAEQAPPEEEEVEEVAVVPLECKDTMVSNEYLQKKNLKPGDSFEALCSEQCATNEEAKVYGTRVYSEDSSLCKASEHMGVNMKGKKFKVIVERFRNMYESGAQNGIQSEMKMTNEGSKSVSFEGVKDEAMAALDAIKVGQKIDLYDEKKKIWQPGVIKATDRRKIKMLFVTVAPDGYSEQFDESIQWPNPEKVDYCGQKLTTRKDCDKESESQDKSKKKPPKPIKICFTNGDSCSPDYPEMVVDNGFVKKLQANGRTYGWDIDASGNLRKRGKQQDPLTDNMILFPPDVKSQWCSGAMVGKISCSPIRWSIDLPNGLYNVKVTVGDPLYSSAVSINLNDLPLMDAVLLKRNQFFTKEMAVLVGTDKLVVDGICKNTDCKNVWSRINYIEITKATAPKPAPKEAAKKLGCGNAYSGGDCSTGLLVENCVFPSLDETGVHNCGQLYKLVRIPKFYECKDQREKYKCIKVDFKDAAECKKNCPGKCRAKDCNIVPF